MACSVFTTTLPLPCTSHISTDDTAHDNTAETTTSPSGTGGTTTDSSRDARSKAVPTSKVCVVALSSEVPLDRLDATLAFDGNTAWVSPNGAAAQSHTEHAHVHDKVARGNFV